MRVTNSMLVKDMLWNANNNLVEMAKRQRELSSGKKIHRPSDDPVGVTQVLKFKTDIREAEQYKKNIDDALGWLEISESSLHNLKDILQRVRELTVQAANGTNTPDDTRKIKTEVEQLSKEIAVIGNATSAGRYLFSGLETNKPLFKDDGTYNIELTTERVDLKHRMTYEVSVGEVMDVGVHPVDLFGVVPLNNFFESYIKRDKVETTKSTQTTFISGVNFLNDFTSSNLNATLGGITFNVDESLLNLTPSNPMTQQRLLSVLREAPQSTPAGSAVLGDQADIFFDADGKLVLRAKAHGNLALAFPAVVSAGFVTPVITPGTSAGASVVTGNANLSDTAIASETGIHTLVLQLGDVRKNISVDFSSIGSATALVSSLQSAIDISFPPANSIVVGGSNGSPLTFTITGANDGTTKTLALDSLKASESEMIGDLRALMTALEDGNKGIVGASLSRLDYHLDKVLTVLGEVGGKVNRIEFIATRVNENIISFTSLMSKVQDVDMAEAIMFFKNLENVYRASLSVGSKVIQPSLVDFIR